MRLIEIVYSHAQFDELPPERIFAPLGLEVYTECHEHPEDDPNDHINDMTAFIDNLPFDPPAGFVEVDRYENEDNIVLLALKPLTPLAELLLAQEETGEALAAIARERRRQVEAEGWSAEHDDYENQSHELCRAASRYLDVAAEKHLLFRFTKIKRPDFRWPFHSRWWKPSPARTRNLEKAGALTLAEMERLARAEQREGGEA